MAIKFGISGLASKQMFHYGQVILSGTHANPPSLLRLSLSFVGDFKKYDYGSKTNLQMYNSTKPPLYQLHNVKAPIALFYSAEDPFGNTLVLPHGKHIDTEFKLFVSQMVEKLKTFLPNVALDNQMTLPSWNHLDFVLARNVRQEIHEPLYQLFRKYSEEL